MKQSKLNILFDSAWGSSGKGAAASRLGSIFGIDVASSNNFPNAGHTVIKDGEKYVFKVLPSPAALLKSARKEIKLVIGPTSGFFLDQLSKEIKQVSKDGTGNDVSLIIHSRASVVSDRHTEMESPNGDMSTLHISSTMSGSGAAAAEKMMRKKSAVIVASLRDGAKTTILEPIDFYSYVRNMIIENQKMWLHEVSQGWALSLNCGTHYPQCTFRDCTPQQACADMCATPDMVGDVYMNIRSFPIRVGNNYDGANMIGYSGDFLPDQQEMSWQEIGQNAEMPSEYIEKLAESERTTVTKKIRRVATQSWELVANSARLSGATKLILNFPQYIHFSALGVRGGIQEFKKMHHKIHEYVDKLQTVTNLPVVMIGTGADHDDYVWLL